MKQGIGLPVYPGVAIGSVVVYRKSQGGLPSAWGDAAQEQKKFEDAVTEAKQQLEALFEKAKAELGEDKAAIVEVQMLMLDDLDYLEGCAAEIAGGKSAAAAALECGENMAEIFAALDDEYMKARAADIRDVSQRVSDILCGGSGFHLPEGNFLLAAEVCPLHVHLVIVRGEQSAKPLGLHREAQHVVLAERVVKDYGPAVACLGRHGYGGVSYVGRCEVEVLRYYVGGLAREHEVQALFVALKEGNVVGPVAVLEAHDARFLDHAALGVERQFEAVVAQHHLLVLAVEGFVEQRGGVGLGQCGGFGFAVSLGQLLFLLGLLLQGVLNGVLLSLHGYLLWNGRVQFHLTPERGSHPHRTWKLFSKQVRGSPPQSRASCRSPPCLCSGGWI